MTAHDEPENVPYMDRKLRESSFQCNWNRIKSYFLEGDIQESMHGGQSADFQNPIRNGLFCRINS